MPNVCCIAFYEHVWDYDSGEITPALQGDHQGYCWWVWPPEGPRELEHLNMKSPLGLNISWRLSWTFSSMRLWFVIGMLLYFVVFFILPSLSSFHHDVFESWSDVCSPVAIRVMLIFHDGQRSPLSRCKDPTTQWIGHLWGGENSNLTETPSSYIKLCVCLVCSSSGMIYRSCENMSLILQITNWCLNGFSIGKGATILRGTAICIYFPVKSWKMKHSEAGSLCQ